MSAHWLAEIRIPGQVAEGKLRHPFFKGIREDLARSSRRNRNATPTRIPFLCGQYRTDATGMKGRLRVCVGQCSGGGCGPVEEPPSLERVRSPSIQHQGRGSVGRLVDPHMNRTAKPSLIKVDPTSTPLTRRRPRAGGQHHLEGPGAIANRLL